MSDHTHDWKPLEGENNRYVCACTITGYRNRGGQIVPHKVQNVYRDADVTRRVMVGSSVPGGKRAGSGWWSK